MKKLNKTNVELIKNNFNLAEYIESFEDSKGAGFVFCIGKACFKYVAGKFYFMEKMKPVEVLPVALIEILREEQAKIYTRAKARKEFREAAKRFGLM